MVFKIDFEKTYDSVTYDFLWFILDKMRFRVRWMRWIQGCVTYARVSMLVNGSTDKEFRMEKRLR